MDPNQHSAVAATIWEVIYAQVANGPLDPARNQRDAGELAVEIAEKLAKVYKLNLGRRK